MNHTLLFPAKEHLFPDELIKTEEKNYDAQIEACTQNVLSNKALFVFLAGPSCSGKTTTALRLEKALLKEGKKVLAFSTDDFFFEREQAPLNEDGTPNYDDFSHTDSDLIVSVLSDLAKGKETKIPIFDFLKSGRVGYKDVDPKEYDIFLLEGIHALNDKILSCISPQIPSSCFYLDVTEKVGLEGEEVFLLPEEVRFCRRMIRDYKHRGASVDLTWRLWKNVRRAEEKILHPFKKNASIIISTSFSYEIPVEKCEILPLLKEVKKEEPLFPEAKRLLSILEKFPCLPEEVVPKTSVLREFID